jgi:hypothetical protein
MPKDTRIRDRKAYDAERYRKNRDKIRAQVKAWRLNNPDKEKLRKKIWVEANRDHVRKRNREYIKTRRKNDPQFALRRAITNRTHCFMRQRRAQGSVTEAIGCSWQELYAYIESKFQPGMTWKNRGKWHIDHIKPLSSFDLTDPEQFRQAAHYTNLQPLWALDNLKKSNKD